MDFCTWRSYPGVIAKWPPLEIASGALDHCVVAFRGTVIKWLASPKVRLHRPGVRWAKGTSDARVPESLPDIRVTFLTDNWICIGRGLLLRDFRRATVTAQGGGGYPDGYRDGHEYGRSCASERRTA